MMAMGNGWRDRHVSATPQAAEEIFTADYVQGRLRSFMDTPVDNRRACEALCKNVGTPRCQCPGPIAPRFGICIGGFEIKASDPMEASRLLDDFVKSETRSH